MKGLAWYLAKRVLSVLIIVALIATVIFAANFLVADPQQNILPKGGSPELRDRIASELKLNEPLPTQYVNFMVKTLSGKFFVSISVIRGANTSDFIYDYFSQTLALFGAVLVPALILGWALGRQFSGRKESMLLSRSARFISLGFASIPIISAGLVLYYVISNTSPGVRLMGTWVNPWIASFPIAVGTYILLMKGKERHFGDPGVKSSNRASDEPIPTTSITKLYVAWVMVIVVTSEAIFNYRGLGLLTWRAVNVFDATVMMASIFLIAVTIASTNFGLDLISPFFKSWLSKRTKAIEPEAREPIGLDPTGTINTDEDQGRTLNLVAKDYFIRPISILSIGIVLAYVVLAFMAPVLATVPHPNDIVNREENNPFNNVMNPLPPSFDRSQKGFIHPLGTDIIGRDVYSQLLLGTGEPLIILATLVAVTLTVGVVIWMAATYAARFSQGTARILGGISSVVADSLIAFPILLLFITRGFRLQTGSTTFYVLLIAIPMLFWACSFRAIRVGMPSIRRLLAPLQGNAVDMTTMRSVMLTSSSSILYVSKFIVLFGFLTTLLLPFFVPLQGTLFDSSWALLSAQAYDYGAALSGAWWLVLPQLVLASLLVGAVYKALDTLEQVMARRFGTLA